MLLFAEYRADLLDHFYNEPDATFESVGRDKKSILADKELIDNLWVTYQKNVDEYKVPPYQAFRQILAETFCIPEPESYDEES